MAVPGTMYAMMSGLEKYGKFSAKTLFEPVIDRARNTGWLVGMASKSLILTSR